MNLLMIGAIFVVAALMFVFYGMKKDEEINEKKAKKVRFTRNHLNEYWLDIIEYVTTGYYEKASTLLKELIEKNPDEYPAYLVFSYILRKQGKVDKALNVDKAIFAGTINISRRGKKAIQKSLIIDYAENGMLKTALKTIEENGLDSDNDELILALGKDVAYKLGDFAKAFTYAKKLLEEKKARDKSELGYIAADLAKDALKKDDVDTARKLLKEGRRYNPDCGRLIFVDSYLHHQEGSTAKAQELFTKALKKSPGSVYHVKDKMFEIFDQDHHKMAKSLKKAVSSNVDNAPLHVAYASELRELGRLDEAAEEYLEAILYAPDSKHILFLMMDLYIEMGNWEKVRDIRDDLKGIESETVYSCTECGARYDHPTWYCDNCGTWGCVTIRL